MINYFASASDGLSFNITGNGPLGGMPWTIVSARAAFAGYPPFTRQSASGDAQVFFRGYNFNWHWSKRLIQFPDGRGVDWGASVVTRDGRLEVPMYTGRIARPD